MYYRYSPSRSDIAGVAALVVLVVVLIQYPQVGEESSSASIAWMVDLMGVKSLLVLFAVASVLSLFVSVACLSHYFVGERAKKKRAINEALVAIVHSQPCEILDQSNGIAFHLGIDDAVISSDILLLAEKKKLAEALFVCLFSLDVIYHISQREARVFATLSRELTRYRISSDAEWIVNFLMRKNHSLGAKLSLAMGKMKSDLAIESLQKDQAQKDLAEKQRLDDLNPSRQEIFSRATSMLL